MTEAPLVTVDGAVKHFAVRGGGLRRRSGGTVRAVDGVDLVLHRGETLGLVGETGCGKSTLGRCITALETLDAGHIAFDGEDIATHDREARRRFRRDVQMIFQDPYGSLNPRRRVGAIIGDPLAIHGIATGRERQQRVQELMEVVGLNPDHYSRFPAEFSGGQRQRIGVARALASRPRLIICDEPVSALDVSIQAQIINLLRDLQTEFGLTYLFIGHDLSVIEHVSDRVAVMYLGKVVEVRPAAALFAAPAHPYTSALLSATMVPDPDAQSRRGTTVLTGDVPSPFAPPPGCRFHTRCPKAQPRCGAEEPALEPRLDQVEGEGTACHFPMEAGEVLPHAAEEIAANR